jgi:hypothetical protein
MHLPSLPAGQRGLDDVKPDGRGERFRLSRIINSFCSEILSYFSISAYIPAARELFGALQGPGKLAAILYFQLWIATSAAPSRDANLRSAPSIG